MGGKPLVSVGNYFFPEPSSYSAITSTVVDSARNVQGVMVGSVVRENVSKIELSWRYLSVTEWEKILKCFTKNNNGNFINNVTFFDQSSGGWITKKMYVSDRNSEMWRRDSETGKVLGWVGCSLSLVEV